MRTFHDTFQLGVVDGIAVMMITGIDCLHFLRMPLSFDMHVFLNFVVAHKKSCAVAAENGIRREVEIAVAVVADRFDQCLLIGAGLITLKRADQPA